MVDTSLLNNTTICAPATASGGAIGIIRVSGAEAINIVDQLFTPQNGKTLHKRASGSLSYGVIHDDKNEIIDEVIVSIFRAPHSYTGENCTEISCHGSSYILSKIVDLLVRKGCKMALPGEFTKRAYLNGKMDLSQAEAVADLIAATTQANHRMAMQQMRGGYSERLHSLRDKLLHITSLLELELDFSDHEDLEFADRSEIISLAEKVEKHIANLCNSFKLGNALKRGLPVAIVGETNAGKSTLLNAIIGEERALVSNIHGTTRDTIEECYNLNGTLIRFIDTAGIRKTNDIVEKMGIDRTFEKIKEAEVVLLVMDATCFIEQYRDVAPTLLPLFSNKSVVVVLNKIDLIVDIELKKILEEVSMKFSSTYSIMAISAHRTCDVNKLVETISKIVSNKLYESNVDMLVSNVRHYEALSLALESIHRVIGGLQNGLSGDFISQDLRDCIHYLGEIVGEISSDDVLQNIFKSFCVGK